MKKQVSFDSANPIKIEEKAIAVKESFKEVVDKSGEEASKQSVAVATIEVEVGKYILKTDSEDLKDLLQKEKDKIARNSLELGEIK